MKVRKILCSMLRLARWNFGSNLFSTLCRLPSIRPQGPLTRVSLCSEAKSKEKRRRIEIKKVQMDVNPRRRRKAANLNSWVKKWSELFWRPGIFFFLSRFWAKKNGGRSFFNWSCYSSKLGLMAEITSYKFGPFAYFVRVNVRVSASACVRESIS